MTLRVSPLRFEFQAIDPIRFAPGQAANLFRGAFGLIFRRVACAEECPGAKSCTRANECAYARMFEPRTSPADPGPSGFGDPPRPFVLRAASFDGRSFEAGERFILDINIFDPDVPALNYFAEAFSQLCKEGLGVGRPRIGMLHANQLPLIDIDLAAPRQPVRRITVTFLTPTELKSGGETLREPRFDALLRRARDRVTGLIERYQASAFSDPPDFRGMGDRAAAVRMTAGKIHEVNYQRHSTRTGQRHGLGGFIGVADYEGDLAEFLPYLEAAWWTGVGRLTVWGNGMLRVVAHESARAGRP